MSIAPERLDLVELEDLLTSPGHLDLLAVAGFFAAHLEAEGAVVFVVDTEDNHLTVGGAYPAGGVEESALRIPVGYGVTGLVALNGRPVTLPEDSPRNALHRRLLRLEDDQTVARLCVPARGLGGAIAAVVSVHRRAGHAFDDQDVRRASRAAGLLGLRLYAEGLMGAEEEHRSQRDRLIAHAIQAQEAERRRIAGDLHDGVTQALASLAFHLSAAAVSLSAISQKDPFVDQAASEIESARRLAGLAYDETRAAISGLHSLMLDDLGLVPALESLTKNIPQIEIEFRTDDPESFDDVPDHAAAVLYRIAQEGINNAVKHSGAQKAVLSIRRAGDTVVLGLTDDGVGFDVQKVREAPASTAAGEHYGLASMAERCALVGARLRIESAEGRGTTVMVELPLSPA